MQKQAKAEVQRRLNKPEYTEVQDCLSHTVFSSSHWNKEAGRAEIIALVNTRPFSQEELKALQTSVDVEGEVTPVMPMYSVLLRFGMFDGGCLATQFIYAGPDNEKRVWVHIKFKNASDAQPINTGDVERVIYGGSVMSFIMEFLLATRVVTDIHAVDRLLYGVVDHTVH